MIVQVPLGQAFNVGFQLGIFNRGRGRNKPRAGRQVTAEGIRVPKGGRLLRQLLPELPGATQFIGDRGWLMVTAVRRAFGNRTISYKDQVIIGEGNRLGLAAFGQLNFLGVLFAVGRVNNDILHLTIVTEFNPVVL